MKHLIPILKLLIALGPFSLHGYAEEMPPSTDSTSPVVYEDAQSLVEKAARDNVFFNFDYDRLRAKSPTSKMEMGERAKIYLRYVSDLRQYGLVPKQVDNCIYSLLPQEFPQEEANWVLPLNDPCYPTVATEPVGRPTGMEIDEFLRRRGKNFDSDAAEPTEFFGRGGNGSSGGGGSGRRGGD